MKVLTLTAAISVLSNLVFCLNLTIPKVSFICGKKTFLEIKINKIMLF